MVWLFENIASKAFFKNDHYLFYGESDCVCSFLAVRTMLEYSLNETLINDVGVQVRYSKEFYDTHNWDPFLQNVDVLGTAYCLKNRYCLKSIA